MMLKLIVFVITVVWIVLGDSDGELTKGKFNSFEFSNDRYIYVKQPFIYTIFQT